jgi:hypothetical protein
VRVCVLFWSHDTGNSLSSLFVAAKHVSDELCIEKWIGKFVSAELIKQYATKTYGGVDV